MMFSRQPHVPEGVSPEKMAVMMRNLVKAAVAFPEVNWVDAVSSGQLGSKLWLLDFLTKRQEHYGSAWVIGGWVGMLPHMLLTHLPTSFERIISIDLDEEACRAADRFLRHFVEDGLKFAAIKDDAMTLDYRQSHFDRIKENGDTQTFQVACNTIINTSWEHFDDPGAWFSLLPKDKFVIIQANTNWDAEGHVSCPKDLDDLCSKTPFRKRVYADELKFPVGSRLMTAGYT
ncbi:class I SAM-dependent methyltransferase [Shimia ponticola]|uniref:class I SAM-dependent methyltransferase n=1 Tax=Shimia ponticola TaxID=2582893 RepID=UPI0011BE2454|nr:class I SAM-dependent methyltransferase [Shimia ponticola]